MTINANPLGHNATVGPGGLLKKVVPVPKSIPGLWAWAWAGESDVNLSTSTISGPTTVTDTVINLAAPGINDFVNVEVGDERHFRPVPKAAGTVIDGGLYTLPYTTLLSDIGATRQFMTQATSMDAAGEFYLIFSAYMERTSGHRYFVGNATDGVRLNTDSGAVTLLINNISYTVAPASSVAKGVIVEIWRDATNNLHCWVNGVDVTNGTLSSTDVFALSGLGGKGAGSSEADDNTGEFLAYNTLPTIAQRLDLRNYVNGHWSMY